MLIIRDNTVMVQTTTYSNEVVITEANDGANSHILPRNSRSRTNGYRPKQTTEEENDQVAIEKYRSACIPTKRSFFYLSYWLTSPASGIIDGSEDSVEWLIACVTGGVYVGVLQLILPRKITIHAGYAVTIIAVL